MTKDQGVVLQLLEEEIKSLFLKHICPKRGKVIPIIPSSQCVDLPSLPCTQSLLWK